MAAVDDVIAVLVEHARPRLLARFRADSCIASARVAVDVARACGLAARPYVTEALAVNAQARQVFDAQRPFTAADVGAGARTVQTDLERGEGDDRFPGHLVAVIDGRLVDLSADQMHRPHKGIFLTGPVSFALPDGWFDGTHFAGLDLPFGGALAYRRVRNPAVDYRVSNNWTDRTQTAPIVADLVRLVT